MWKLSKELYQKQQEDMSNTRMHKIINHYSEDNFEIPLLPIIRVINIKRTRHPEKTKFQSKLQKYDEKYYYIH